MRGDPPAAIPTAAVAAIAAAISVLTAVDSQQLPHIHTELGIRHA